MTNAPAGEGPGIDPFHFLEESEDPAMNHEEYDNMIHTFESCTPSESIRKMVEMTDENSLLCIPAWPYDNDEEHAETYYVF